MRFWLASQTEMPLETNTKFIFFSVNHVSGLLLFCSHPAIFPALIRST